MVPAPWVGKAQRVLVPLVSIDLAVQYILGLLTSAYAPGNGFNSTTDFGALDAHWTNGEVLGVLVIIMVVVVALSRDRPALGMSIVTLIAVIVAAVAGMAFVNNVPNPPSATITMGLAFLVAFGAQQALLFRTLMRSPSTPPGIGNPPAPATPA